MINAILMEDKWFPIGVCGPGSIFYNHHVSTGRVKIESTSIMMSRQLLIPRRSLLRCSFYEIDKEEKGSLHGLHGILAARIHFIGCLHILVDSIWLKLKLCSKYK